MNISFEYSFEPTNIMEIEEFESKYNISLPEDYKRFLLENNGGKPSIRRFKTADGKHASSKEFMGPIE